jgi:putative oxidoreductase
MDRYGVVGGSSSNVRRMSQQVDLAVLILRLAVGLTIVMHGVKKYQGGVAGTAGWFGSIGMRPPLLQAWMAIATEVGGGLLLAAGLLTPLAAASVISLMVVAFIVAHRKNGFFIFNPNQGWEYVFILAVGALAIGIIGPGKYSLDKAFGIKWTASNGWIGTWLTVLVGVLSAVALLATSYRPRPAVAAATGKAAKSANRPAPKPSGRPAQRPGQHRKR